MLLKVRDTSRDRIQHLISAAQTLILSVPRVGVLKNIQGFIYLQMEKSLKVAAAAAQSPRYLNVAFLGEHASGKSTVAGHLLKLLKSSLTVQSDKITKKPLYASLFDTLSEERSMGLTINFHQAYAQTANTNFQFTDCPGYPKYFKNLLRGLQGAQVAVFVLDVNGACFEECRDQLTDQLTACFHGQVDNLVVCVNRMDHREVQWERTQYDEIASEFRLVADKIGYKEDQIKAIIPISGTQGDNLMIKSDRMIWYEGPTLIKALHQVKINYPEELKQQPFMMIVKSIHRVPCAETIIAGVVLQGSVWKDMEVFINSTRCISTSVKSIILRYSKKYIIESIFGKSIQAHRKAIAEASVGMSVGLQLKNLQAYEIKVGDVVKQHAEPIIVKNKVKITASIVIIVFFPEDSLNQITSFIHKNNPRILLYIASEIVENGYVGNLFGKYIIDLAIDLVILRSPNL